MKLIGRIEYVMLFTLHVGQLMQQCVDALHQTFQIKLEDIFKTILPYTCGWMADVMTRHIAAMRRRADVKMMMFVNVCVVYRTLHFGILDGLVKR